MKKFLAFGAAMLLGLGAFGAIPAKKEAKSVTVEDMPTVMQKYVSNNRYTKKSRIFVDKSAVGYDAKIFHASYDKLELTTYYASGVLLMGDLDGGFAHTNSGYANDGNGNMDHFISQDGLGGLVAPANRTVDYTVHGKEMKDYFFTLPDLIANFDSSKWVYDGDNSQFYHNISSLEVNGNGDYVDTILKQYQYFAAPMLLQDGAEHYLSPKSIVVKEENSALNIRIYASNTDSGKLTSANNLLAESRVYADLVTPGYYLIGEFGGNYDWQIIGGRAMAPQGDNLAQIENVPLSEGKYQICQLKNDGTVDWFHTLGAETPDYFAELVGNDVHIKYSGNYNVYLNNQSKIFLVRNDYNTLNFTFTYVDSAWTSWNPRPYNFSIHLVDNQKGQCGAWGSAGERMTDNDGTYTISIRYNGTVSGIYFYFYQTDNGNPAEKKTEDIKGSIFYHNNDNLIVNVNPASFTWQDNVIKTGISISVA